ncbi:hypothetical protein GE21DRAFT_7463 [Neurospora crassa]|uniref:Ribonuclease T1 n=1 Tax=Neurospora crassa (strain ATCC 24698 / 74-OR23-1A / CBS 708.71 / DSM 1257 / FGSC 987) TaxID=367110 RepID=V5ILH5_NEUCR|nr:ribonuclease T1 [Neurospora crassa OR74A]ESA42487.1 ribonuclease T1 [Neurospora crassa OR74A]KHE88337.1 hypothetical protein GE21DRAFT_7463 [Neurospora crassa]|eukprot:XP_011394458.1 ribonuclease T1 [Neurospora crassa OR74A]
MVQLLSAFVSLLSVVAVSGAAIPAPAPEAVVDVAPETATIEPTGNFTAQACMYICGSVCYSSSAISAALNKGYSYYEDGATAGSTTPTDTTTTRASTSPPPSPGTSSRSCRPAASTLAALPVLIASSLTPTATWTCSSPTMVLAVTTLLLATKRLPLGIVIGNGRGRQ